MDFLNLKLSIDQIQVFGCGPSKSTSIAGKWQTPTSHPIDRRLNRLGNGLPIAEWLRHWLHKQLPMPQPTTCIPVLVSQRNLSQSHARRPAHHDPSNEPLLSATRKISYPITTAIGSAVPQKHPDLGMGPCRSVLHDRRLSPRPTSPRF